MDSPFKKKKTLKTAADYTKYCGSHFGLTTLLVVAYIYVTPLLSYFIVVSWTSSKSYSMKYTLYCRICMVNTNYHQHLYLPKC